MKALVYLLNMQTLGYFVFKILRTNYSILWIFASLISFHSIVISGWAASIPSSSLNVILLRFWGNPSLWSSLIRRTSVRLILAAISHSSFSTMPPAFISNYILGISTPLWRNGTYSSAGNVDLLLTSAVAKESRVKGEMIGAPSEMAKESLKNSCRHHVSVEFSQIDFVLLFVWDPCSCSLTRSGWLMFRAEIYLLVRHDMLYTPHRLSVRISDQNRDLATSGSMARRYLRVPKN